MKLTTGIAVCLLPFLIQSTWAGVIVTTPGGTVDVNGTGFVDVLLSTTAGDNLAAAFYEYGVVPFSGGSALTITGIEGGVAGDVFGEYVFAGTDHFGQELDVSTPLPGTNFIASDSLDLDPGVIATDDLLTRIHFQHTAGPGGAAAAEGDQFHLTLLDNGDTVFEDDAFNALSIDPASFASAVITVTSGGGGAASVPEPSGAVMLLACAGTLVMRRRRSVESDQLA